MARVHSRVAALPHLLRVGSELYPIYGDEDCGWSIEERDLSSRAAIRFRYRSLDELFFVLANLNVSGGGSA